MEFKLELKEAFKKYNIKLTDKKISQFEEYYQMLIEWNKKFNLTRITSQSDVIQKHFLDSVIIFNLIKDDKLKVIDVGTGAGFPSLPLKILFPKLELLVIDSINKKITFVRAVISKLNLCKVQALHARAENLAQDRAYREQFDLCLSRAVAKMNTLAEYCLPFVKVGGNFLAYKAKDIKDELFLAQNAITTLGGKVQKIIKVDIEGTKRSIVCITKIKPTPKRFPRKGNKARLDPL